MREGLGFSSDLSSHCAMRRHQSLGWVWTILLPPETISFCQKTDPRSAELTLRPNKDAADPLGSLNKRYRNIQISHVMNQMLLWNTPWCKIWNSDAILGLRRELKVRSNMLLQITFLMDWTRVGWEGWDLTNGIQQPDERNIKKDPQRR